MHQKQLLTFFIIFFFFHLEIVSGQGLTPGSKREEQHLSENSKEVFKSMDRDSLFQVTKISEKWKEESAVFIAIKSTYSYIRETRADRITELVEKRIKLLDKAAVSELSEFYYYIVSDNSYGVSNNQGFRITKPSGKVIEINTKDAVDVTDQVPDIYKSYYENNPVKFKKIAIPDLQVGDIIDYFIKNEYLKDVVNEVSFDPFVFTLNGTYPIIHQEFDFTVDRGFYINFGFYNNAPSLIEEEAGVDKTGRKRGNLKTYKLIDNQREKISNDFWYDSRRVDPYVKFQVYYETSVTLENTENFIGETGKIKSSVSPLEVQEVITRKVESNKEGSELLTNQEVSKEMARQIERYLRSIKGVSNEKLAEIAYCYFRFLFTNKYNHPVRYFSSIESTTRSATVLENKTISETIFVRTLLDVFKDREIKAEIAVLVPKSIGTTKDILLSDDYVLGVKVDGSDKILFPFDNYSTVRYSNPDLDGAEGYTFTPVRNKRINTTNEIKIPSSDYKENIYRTNTEVDIDGKFDLIKVKRKNSKSGFFKNESSPILLLTYDFLSNDLHKYDPDIYQNQLKEDASSGSANSRKAEEKRKEVSNNEEISNEVMQIMKNNLKNEFEDIGSLNNFYVTESGRTDSTPLIYSEEFMLKNLINKAGSNYSFNIGKLIGNQMKLSENYLKRNNEINFPFARMIRNEIAVNLPDGYYADGLDDLTFNIENESASFKSSAEMQGSKIYIKVEKIYKKSTDKKENWKNWTDMLETAYTFSQKKVILRKGNSFKK